MDVEFKSDLENLSMPVMYSKTLNAGVHVNCRRFSIIRSQGDKALFGGFSTLDMKSKLKVTDNRPLADFLPTLTIKAKDFATELTSHNTVEKDLKGKKKM